MKDKINNMIISILGFLLGTLIFQIIIRIGG